MEDFVKSFESFQNESKMWVSEVKPKKGAMHKALDIPEDKKVTDVYKSGKKLAEDLVAKVGKKKAAGMINFAANADKNENIFDVAQKHLSKIEESIEYTLEEKEKIIKNQEKWRKIREEFKIGEIVWEKENKCYGVIMDNYLDLDDAMDEIRLDSNGNQSIEDLAKLGSKEDKGLKDELIQCLKYAEYSCLKYFPKDIKKSVNEYKRR